MLRGINTVRQEYTWSTRSCVRDKRVLHLEVEFELAYAKGIFVLCRDLAPSK
jgi:hypothetical protein